MMARDVARTDLASMSLTCNDKPEVLLICFCDVHK